MTISNKTAQFVARVGRALESAPFSTVRCIGSDLAALRYLARGRYEGRVFHQFPLRVTVQGHAEVVYRR